jgi:peptidoglycan/LPS O-acetylase OafA/YrhL
MVMLFVAATLGIASYLHLTGNVTGTPPFDPDHAGIAEAVIGGVLLVAAIVMLRRPHRARSVGLGALGFATVGFLVGLNFTTQGGHAPDVAYHLVFLPVLVACGIVLARTHPRGRAVSDRASRRSTPEQSPVT